jgi:TusA-related sulfurtransferase
MNETALLDAKGLFCPAPIYLTAKKIKEMEQGQVLKVISDDPGILQDMPAWCKASRNELVGFEEKNGTYLFLVRKAKDQE